MSVNIFTPDCIFWASWKVHTSPPVYSLAQVMAGFRTRSQMMLSYIEEQDEVLHSHFSDEEEKNTDSKKKPAFR